MKHSDGPGHLERVKHVTSAHDDRSAVPMRSSIDQKAPRVSGEARHRASHTVDDGARIGAANDGLSRARAAETLIECARVDAKRVAVDVATPPTEWRRVICPDCTSSRSVTSMRTPGMRMPPYFWSPGFRGVNESTTKSHAAKLPVVQQTGNTLSRRATARRIAGTRRRAPPHRQVRSLECDQRRIDERAGERRQIRRRPHPRKSGLVEPHRASPSGHRHDAQRRVDAEDAVVEQRQLTHRHSVTQRERV